MHAKIEVRSAESSQCPIQLFNTRLACGAGLFCFQQGCPGRITFTDRRFKRRQKKAPAATMADAKRGEASANANPKPLPMPLFPRPSLNPRTDAQMVYIHPHARGGRPQNAPQTCAVTVTRKALPPAPDAARPPRVLVRNVAVVDAQRQPTVVEPSYVDAPAMPVLDWDFKFDGRGWSVVWGEVPAEGGGAAPPPACADTAMMDSTFKWISAPPPPLALPWAHRWVAYT